MVSHYLPGAGKYVQVYSASSARPNVAASARRAFAVSMGKAARGATRWLGKGNSATLPGTVTLAIDPGSLAGLLAEIPRGAVLVTGSTGKGMTCRMLAQVMRASGLHPVVSSEEANQPAGVATTMVAHAAITGHLPADFGAIGLFDVDEGSLTGISREVSQPRAVVVTNIFGRLDRYPEPAAIRALLEQAMRNLPAQTALVLNADDPRVASLAPDIGNPRLYFGVDNPELCRERANPTSDFPRCPRCDGELTYACVYYAHLGHWECGNCGMARPQPEVCLTKAELTESFSTRLSLVTPAAETMLEIPLPGLHNAYNALAAAAAASQCELPERSLSAIEQVTAGFSGMEKVRVAGNDVYLVLAKNAGGYAEILRAVLGDRQPKRMMLGLADDPGKQPDTSWIWDVDFASLLGLIPAPVVSGNRAADLAVRLKYAGWDGSGRDTRLAIQPDPVRALQTALAGSNAGQPVWVVATPAVLWPLRHWLAQQGYVDDLPSEQTGAGRWQA